MSLTYSRCIWLRERNVFLVFRDAAYNGPCDAQHQVNKKKRLDSFHEDAFHREIF
jgi:hypothetical protein